jgi:Acetyltransferase (GNAT) domain
MFDLPMLFEFLKTQDLNPDVHREIESFLDRQGNSHPFQFPRWICSQDGAGGEDTYCAFVRENDAIVWFALCGVNFPAGKGVRLIRSLVVYRGPACDDSDRMLWGIRRLLEKGRIFGFAYIDIAPDWVEGSSWNVSDQLSGDGWRSLPERKLSLRLNLLPESDALLLSFRKATRYEIRRAEQQGVAVRSARDEGDLQEFQRIYFEMARKKNFLALGRKDLSCILRWMLREQDRGALLLAFNETTLLGGTLVVRSAARSWYVLGATTKDDRLSVGHLLQWHAIRWAKEQGCSEHDFGGYAQDAKTGPALFKRGFCQTVVEFSPPYRYSLKRWLCSVLNLANRLRTKAKGRG